MTVMVLDFKKNLASHDGMFLINTHRPCRKHHSRKRHLLMIGHIQSIAMASRDLVWT